MNRCGLFMAVLLVAGAAVAAADDLDTNYQDLQDAVQKKDVETVKKVAPATSALARQELAKAAGTDPDAAKRQEYLHSVDTYADYALYATAVQAEPAVLVDLMATLERQNPKSKYLDAGYGGYLAALAQTGAAAKVPAIAEKAIANFPQNPDLLIYMANYAANHGQTDRELTFSTRLIALWNSHPKAPEGVDAAEWDRKREASLGPALYMAGMVNAARGRWVDADQQLRGTLGYVKSNATMNANVLLQLGIANYNIGKATMNKARLLDAVKFSKQAAAIPGPVAQQAWHNAQVMQAEADHMR